MQTAPFPFQHEENEDDEQPGMTGKSSSMFMKVLPGSRLMAL